MRCGATWADNAAASRALRHCARLCVSRSAVFGCLLSRVAVCVSLESAGMESAVCSALLRTCSHGAPRGHTAGRAAKARTPAEERSMHQRPHCTSCITVLRGDLRRSSRRIPDPAPAILKPRLACHSARAPGTAVRLALPSALSTHRAAVCCAVLQSHLPQRPRILAALASDSTPRRHAHAPGRSPCPLRRIACAAPCAIPTNPHLNDGTHSAHT